jgi:transcriptional regulator PpsR
VEDRPLVKQFKDPKAALRDVDAETAAHLVGAVADIALVLEGDGTVRDVAFGSDELADELDGTWIGRSWSELVAPDSRGKVADLLREAARSGVTRWRHVNHPAPRGGDLPILYCAVPVGGQGRIVALGREQRAAATLQQRLVDVQQSMEREYGRLRQLELRYRILFETAGEAILVVDAASRRIVEANPAAARLLGEPASRLVGRTFPDGLQPASTETVQALLASVRATGRGEEVRAAAEDGETRLVVAAQLFRQEGTALFLIRLTPLGADGSGASPPAARSPVADLAQHAPDGLVVTGSDGRIVSANAAFLDMVQIPTEAQAKGESLERWLGRPGVDLNVLIANLRQHGTVRLYATTLRGEYGASMEIEVSAVTVPADGQAMLGFVIRNVGRRAPEPSRAARQLPRSVEQLTELVGRVPLKDLVRETTDVIERLCIEAALELTGDNRASAAEILGLSRQSLYVKLRRYGLGDLGVEADG